MELLMEKNEVLDLGPVRRGTEIHCREGCCWITVEGDSRDHIVRAARGCTIDLPGKVVVTALVKTRLCLTEPCPQKIPVPRVDFLRRPHRTQA